MKPYDEFLASKVCIAQPSGFDIAHDEINPALSPHAKVAVKWAIQGGRRALFEAFGLQKTVQQLEIVRIVSEKVTGRGLIVCPLGVKQEFARDAVQRLGWSTAPQFIRRVEEADATGVYLTNYETVRDGKLDPRLFQVASLDEASCLRGFGGTKTFREFMATFAGDRKTMDERTFTEAVKYRFVATATPSPNEYIELLAYAAFLGVMDVSAAKTRFFKRDSTKADHLTIHPHKEREFWLWVSSWALFLSKPSDLGFSDEGYELPELDIRWHEIPSDHSTAGTDRSGQQRMFKNAAIGVTDAASEKRSSLDARIAKMLEIRAEDPDAHRILWHDLEDERRAIEAAVPKTQWKHWEEFRDGNADGLALFERHYSALPYLDGRERDRFAGPGYKTVMLTRDKKALFVWRKFIDDSGQTGINCAIFRNEGPILSSVLIKEAMAIAWMRWPGERLYTFVNSKKVASPNPGFCFKQAGWSVCGKTVSRGLVILEALPAAGAPTVEPIPVLRSVFGTQDLEEREKNILDFSDGLIRELAAKPVIAGSGCNLQRYCHWAIYLGIGFKFNDFIQSVHRVQRFLQKRRVRIDLIYTEAEREIRRELERKWSQHNEMVAQMTALIREYGLSNMAMVNQLTRAMGVERVEARGRDYTLINNDSVKEAAALAENSVGLILTSIPFSSQYEYSPNYADFGHSDNNSHFFSQMEYLTPNLLRALKPGRLAAVHVKDRIVPKGMTKFGFQTVYPFHAATIEHFTRHGFAYMGMKTIVTDVVRENNQTYRLGWSEQCKDGSKMGVGMPEYLLIFRKAPTDDSDGYADDPVRKSKPFSIDADGNLIPFERNGQMKTGTGYSRSRWQIDAHGFTRSSGNRLLQPEELEKLDHATIFKMFREYSLSEVYNFEHHVKIGESMEAKGTLPVTFMLLQPQSWHPDIWTDITRMLTLNGAQSAKGKEMHLCPMQFDLADRAIEQWSMPGEVVLDPFAGIGTVPYRALLKDRKAIGIELSHRYWLDAIGYCQAAEQEKAMPDLFSLEAAA